ncbi:MAG: zinc-binding dehydrogenase, partial [Clostridia bacterium]
IRTNSIYEFPYIKGGFGEYMYVFPGTFCWQVPEEMPSRIAALLDPMAVAMRSVELAMRAPGIFEDSFHLGSTVLVIGDGQIAVLVATIARTLGVQHIILSGFSDQKLKLAQEISGADEIMNSAKLSIDQRRAIITKYNHKNGADVVFQCAGSPYAFRDGVDLLKNVGTMIETGNIVGSKTIQFDPARDLCSKHATYIGMSVNTAATFNKAFQMLCKYEKLGLERIFTHRATLDTLGATMAQGKDPNYMKGWLDFSR